MGCLDRPGDHRGAVVLETGVMLQWGQGGPIGHYELRAPEMTLVSVLSIDPSQQPGLVFTFEPRIDSGRSDAGI
jgi:hypothetical protein